MICLEQLRLGGRTLQKCAAYRFCRRAKRRLYRYTIPRLRCGTLYGVAYTVTDAAVLTYRSSITADRQPQLPAGLRLPRLCGERTSWLACPGDLSRPEKGRRVRLAQEVPIFLLPGSQECGCHTDTGRIVHMADGAQLLWRNPAVPLPSPPAHTPRS